jgi:DNA-binding transcriptional ArsR family regulator
MTENLDNLVKAEFKRGMEEGKKGLTSWRVTWNFKREPFSDTVELREVFVNREEAVVRLARGLGRGVMGLHEIIACIGPHGGGVSATLNTVHAALLESEKVKGVFEKAARFLEVRERTEPDGEVYEENYFDAFLDGIDFAEVRYVIIDDADMVAENLSSFVSRIKDRAGAFKNQPAVVVGLHMWGWLSLSSEFRERISEQIVLPPLNPEHIRALLEGYLAWAREKPGLHPFDEKAISQIVTISRGLPRAAIDVTRKVLQEAAARGLAKVTSGLVDEVAKAFGYRVFSSVEELIVSVDETRDAVIEFVVRRPTGVSSSGLAAITDVRRTTANYHLGMLEQAGFVMKQRRGKEVLYVATEPGRMALELLLFKRLFAEVGASKVAM